MTRAQLHWRLCAWWYAALIVALAADLSGWLP